MYYIFLSDVTMMTFLGAIALAPKTRTLSHVHALAQELGARARLPCREPWARVPGSAWKEAMWWRSHDSHVAAYYTFFDCLDYGMIILYLCLTHGHGT